MLAHLKIEAGLCCLGSRAEFSNGRSVSLHLGLAGWGKACQEFAKLFDEEMVFQFEVRSFITVGHVRPVHLRSFAILLFPVSQMNNKQLLNLTPNLTLVLDVFYPI